jgi:arsenate reductase-like glutaredoxin family protein
MKCEDMRFDVRTQNFRLLRKEISRDDLNEFLQSLPDDAEEAVETDTRFIASARMGDNGSDED